MQTACPIWRNLAVSAALVTMASFGASPAAPASLVTAALPKSERSPQPHGHETSKGELSPLPPSVAFKLWQRHRNVVVLRFLLEHAGYQSTSQDNLDLYDLKLMKLVREFQKSRNLKPTGIPREQTIGALNEMLIIKPEKRGVPVESLKEESAPSAPADVPLPPIRPVKQVAVAHPDVTGSIVNPNGTELPMLDRESIRRMEEALVRYSALERKPGLFAVPALSPHQPLPGESASSVLSTVATRLIAEEFLPASFNPSTDVDAAMRAALREWQRTYGLPVTGLIDAATRRTMNVPVAVRIRQLQASIRRAKKIGGKLPEFYVLVNAAAARVQVIDGSSVPGSFPAIVGRDSRKTPELVSSIPYLQLAPTWTAPQSIVKKDIIPHVRKDVDYLARHHMRTMIGRRVVDPRSVNWRYGPMPTIVQKPGPHNALGLVRFGMNGNGSYYIHGTAQPNLLTRRLSRRFLSSGCVRVGDPTTLAALIVQHSDASWNAETIRAHIAKYDGGWEPGERVVLKHPVTVVWTYMTAWTTPDRRTHFRDDVYRQD